MTVALPTLAELPRQSASQVKNKWRELVREVRASGSVAITNHAEVEMVLVDAAHYERLASGAAALEARQERVLEQLQREFEQRLARVNAPEAGTAVAAVFASRGRLTGRPKAGSGH